MRWLVSLIVFGMIVAGFFNSTLAADEVPGGSRTVDDGEALVKKPGEHEAKVGEKISHEIKGEHDLGLRQPTPILENGKIPGKVTLVSPKALSKVSGTSASLKWEPVAGAEVYHVQVAKDPRYKWMVTENFNVQGQSFDVSGLEAGKQYFWRVAARRPGNDAGYTKGAFSASSFEVQ